MNYTDELEKRVVQYCQDLIRIDTTNFGRNESNGEDKAAEYVAKILSGLNIENQIVGPDSKRSSVLARIAGTDSSLPGIVLHGHLDVVPVEKDKWTKPAFEALIEQDQIWGRGAVDMKNGKKMSEELDYVHLPTVLQDQIRQRVWSQIK